MRPVSRILAARQGERRETRDNQTDHHIDSVTRIRTRKCHFYLICNDPHRMTDQIFGGRTVQDGTTTGIETGTMKRAFHLAILDDSPDHRGTDVRAVIIEDGDARSLPDDHQFPALSSTEERLLFIDVLDATDRMPSSTLWGLVGSRQIGSLSRQSKDSPPRHGRLSHGYCAPVGPSGGSGFRRLDAVSSRPSHSPGNRRPCG